MKTGRLVRPATIRESRPSPQTSAQRRYCRAPVQPWRARRGSHASAVLRPSEVANLVGGAA